MVFESLNDEIDFVFLEAWDYVNENCGHLCIEDQKLVLKAFIEAYLLVKQYK